MGPHRTGFRAWLGEVLIRDHPDLARTAPGGLTLAAAFVGTDMILPVLDGFDEIAKSLRGPALHKLNKADLPVVLTSRPAEYENAVIADVLTGAAVIRLDILTPADLAVYLPRATRSNPGAVETRWHPVITQLTANTLDDGVRNVATALSTPLMVSLARSIYSDNPGREPADLPDTGRFPAAIDIEGHLLASYVPSVYDDPADGRDQNWRLDQVLRWFGYLAWHGITGGSPASPGGDAAPRCPSGHKPSWSDSCRHCRSCWSTSSSAVRYPCSSTEARSSTGCGASSSTDCSTARPPDQCSAWRTASCAIFG